MTMSCLNRQLSRKPLLAGYSQFHQHLLLDLLDRLDPPDRLGKMVKTDKMGVEEEVKVG